jgi:hypothetical protein
VLVLLAMGPYCGPSVASSAVTETLKGIIGRRLTYTATMITVDYLHVCNHAFLNEHRQPCIIGIITNLRAKGLPHHVASMSIAAMVKTPEAVDHDLAFEIGPVDGPHLRRMAITFKPPAGSDGLFLSVQMVQMFFPKPGKYEGRLLYNGNVIARSGFRVLGSTQSPQQTPSAPAFPNYLG